MDIFVGFFTVALWLSIANTVKAAAPGAVFPVLPRSVEDNAEQHLELPFDLPASRLGIRSLVLRVLEEAVSLLDLRLSVGGSPRVPLSAAPPLPPTGTPAALPETSKDGQREESPLQPHNTAASSSIGLGNGISPVKTGLQSLHLGRFLTNFGGRLGVVGNTFLSPMLMRSEGVTSRLQSASPSLTSKFASFSTFDTRVDDDDTKAEGTAHSPSADQDAPRGERLGLSDLQHEILFSLSEAIADELAIALATARAPLQLPREVRVGSLEAEEFAEAFHLEDADVAAGVADIYTRVAKHTLTPREGMQALLTSSIVPLDVVTQRLAPVRLVTETLSQEARSAVAAFESLVARAVNAPGAASVVAPEVDMLLRLFQSGGGGGDYRRRNLQRSTGSDGDAALRKPLPSHDDSPTTPQKLLRGSTTR